MAKSSFSQELGHCIMDEEDDEFETNFYGLSDEDENDNYHNIECVENRASQAGSKVNVEGFESEEEIEIGLPDDWDSQKCDDEDILANQFELNERDFDSDSDSSVYEADIIKEFFEDQRDRDRLLDYKPSFSTKPTSRHFSWDDEEENGIWDEGVGMVLHTDK
uniref:Uncharacterized protein n=1 Tax=Acrobeloides nanus TaxID=290746 RepID=A0A914C284_9BILA